MPAVGLLLERDPAAALCFSRTPAPARPNCATRLGLYARLPPQRLAVPHGRTVTALAISPDGRTLAGVA